MTDNAQDLEMIKETVQNYFDGMYYGDVARLEKAFHAEAFLFGHFHGKFSHMPASGFFKMVASAPSLESKGEPFDMEILSIDVTGQAAAVKVRDVYMKMQFFDYLSLAKVDGEWKIVNKTYHHD
ncbi:Putative lumazine-binding [Desulfatibacillum alkenivorans DSM 16219]|uniref:Putative lumazine-binding n=1 Tax=Desulfatibacillum alkenivorans DSM 16219 TaxID=1121393 RepID=A0A1M6GS88_9BACT|nr:nuclear transport factor 2 family protein [Desulfatibacillum alkenivorans]SHJ12779.1 Putative lumazine-binding [Desulfatibacillum alkenivorans DSM 16219]